MVSKKFLVSTYGILTPQQTRKYQRYKDMRGIGDIAAYAGAKGDKFALSKIKKRKIKEDTEEISGITEQVIKEKAKEFLLELSKRIGGSK